MTSPPTITGTIPDKLFAIFHWTWHVRHSHFNKAFNAREIIDGHPGVVNDYDHPVWAPCAAPADPDQHAYFRGEPLFGYSDGRDKRVIRKRLEMLGDAGLDVLFFEASVASIVHGAPVAPGVS